VKIVDFGMVRLVGSSSKLTNQGAIIGTPHYMAPEQCQGKTADHRADIYSVGILLYRMITGKLPFDGDKWLEVLSQQVHAVPVPPSQHMPAGSLPRALEAVILKAMHKDPAQRYQSMREMMQAVSDGMTESVLHSIEPPRPGASASARAEAQSGTLAGWRGAALGALLALLLAGGGALLLLR